MAASDPGALESSRSRVPFRVFPLQPGFDYPRLAGHNRAGKTAKWTNSILYIEDRPYTDCADVAIARVSLINNPTSDVFRFWGIERPETLRVVLMKHVALTLGSEDQLLVMPHKPPAAV